jgi:UTP--glucose-1-phosphate uridylyltransferase
MRQLLDVSDRYQAPVIAVERVPSQRIHQYGVIKARPVESRVHEVLDLVEKPKPGDAPSDLAIIGRYVLPPEIFEILAGTGADSRGEIQLTDALRRLRARRPIYAVEFALARPDLADDFCTYLKSLNL